jgi:hypothetical protein
MNTFFITGLPRTRSSWLSNFFTYKDSFCFHEAIRLCYNITDMKILFECIKETNIGNSDAWLMFHYDKIMEMFPNSKWVLIKRDFISAFEAAKKRYKFERLPIDLETFSDLKEKLDEFEKEYSPLVIQYETLDDIDVCKRIWEYCLPDIPFNKARWYQLDVLKIDPLERKMEQYHSSESPRTIRDYVIT